MLGKRLIEPPIHISFKIGHGQLFLSTEEATVLRDVSIYAI